MCPLMVLYKKCKDVILYLVLGCCTTAVNVFTYWIFARFVNASVMVSTVIAWFIAVLFAYFTNRKWVFHSEASGVSGVVQEIFSFFGCRIATGGIDWICMWVFVELIGLNDVVIKFIADVIVIVLNYLASKLVIFRSRGNK